MENERTSNREIYDRLGNLERDYSQFTARFDSVADAITRLEQGQLHLAETISSRSRPNWPVIVTAGAGFLTLLVFYTGMISTPISERLNLTAQFQAQMIEEHSGRLDRAERRTEDLYDTLREELSIATRDRFTRSDFERWLDRNQKEIYDNE